MLGGGHQKRAAPWESAPAAHRATKPLVGRLYPQAGPLVHWNWDNFGDTGRRARSQRVVAHHPLAGGGHGVSLGGMYPPPCPLLTLQVVVGWLWGPGETGQTCAH